MTFDKSAYHYDSAMEEYCKSQNISPDALTEEQENIIWERASHHILMLYTWVLEQDAFDEDMHDSEEDISAVKARDMSAYDYFSKYSDLSFTIDDISEDCDDISEFVRAYTQTNKYNKDYADCFSDRGNYTSDFSWADYDLMKGYIDAAYDDFSNGGMSSSDPKRKKSFLDIFRRLFNV